VFDSKYGGEFFYLKIYLNNFFIFKFLFFILLYQNNLKT